MDSVTSAGLIGVHPVHDGLVVREVGDDERAVGKRGVVGGDRRCLVGGQVREVGQGTHLCLHSRRHVRRTGVMSRMVRSMTLASIPNRQRSARSSTYTSARTFRLVTITMPADGGTLCSIAVSAKAGTLRSSSLPSTNRGSPAVMMATRCPDAMTACSGVRSHTCPRMIAGSLP